MTRVDRQNNSLISSVPKKAQNPKKAQKTSSVAKNVLQDDSLRNATASPTKRLKGRKINSYDKNLAPSQSEVKNLEEGIKEHAYLRIQLFRFTADLLKGVAMRTGKPPADIDVWVGRAPKQDGQGTRENHACHSHTASGLMDNLKKHYIPQIIMNGLTPIKKGVLSSLRKMSPEELEELQKNHSDEAFVRKVFDMIWPGESVLSDTEFEDQLNATNKLPRSLNLGCDLSLEKAIRPYVAELIAAVMKGEMTPEKATDLYIVAIQEHFDSKIEELGKKIEVLEGADLKKAEDQLFYHKNERAGTQPLGYDLFQAKRKLEF